MVIGRLQPGQAKNTDLKGAIAIGLDEALTALEESFFDLTDERYMRAYMERLEAFTLSYLRALLQAGAGRIDVVRADDDVGTMDRLMISPAMWRRWYEPAWRRAFGKEVKARTRDAPYISSQGAALTASAMSRRNCS